MAERLRKMNLYPNQTNTQKIVLDTYKIPNTITVGVKNRTIPTISCTTIMHNVFTGQRGSKGGCGCGR